MVSFLIERIAADSILEKAYDWLCQKRANYSHNNDVWDLRCQWPLIKSCLIKTLLSGEYQFSQLTEIRLPDVTVECWSSKDALVLKAMALVLGEYLEPHISSDCHNVAGHGGTKQTVMATFNHLAPYAHVMKSDVLCYYASIDHITLFDMLTERIPDRYVLRLIWQYLKRCICFGGLYRDVERGISLGCPLSPLMAALYLKPLDDRMKEAGVFYARFMDDWVVIAPSRWKIRKAVRIVNEILSMLKVEQHPDKTFIGRATKGFDFLGYHLTPGGVSVAQSVIDNAIAHITRLYEQGADHASIGRYLKR